MITTILFITTGVLLYSFVAGRKKLDVLENIIADSKNEILRLEAESRAGAEESAREITALKIELASALKKKKTKTPRNQ